MMLPTSEGLFSKMGVKGSKISKKWVTSFMDSPICQIVFFNIWIQETITHFLDDFVDYFLNTKYALKLACIFRFHGKLFPRGTSPVCSSSSESSVYLTQYFFSWNANCQIYVYVKKQKYLQHNFSYN